jgi:limonene-1,2-epoxide hydrolase
MGYTSKGCNRSALSCRRAVPSHDRPMNAAERFFAASRAHDIDAAASELTPHVVMLNPASDEPVLGREAVAAALRGVAAACDEFRHTHLLANAAGDQTPLYGLVFEARVGNDRLRGIDLLEIDKALDRIATFTVMARPIPALLALGARMTGSR